MKTNTKTILVVEDDPSYRLIIRKAFEKVDLKDSVYEAVDGIDGLDFLFRRNKYADRTDYELPSLVLLDLKMPRMDGYDMLSYLKSKETTKQIPIIVLTTSESEEDINQCYRLGANAYLSKPNTNTELVEKIQFLKRFWYSAVELPQPTINYDCQN